MGRIIKVKKLWTEHLYRLREGGKYIDLGTRDQIGGRGELDKGSEWKKESYNGR